MSTFKIIQISLLICGSLVFIIYSRHYLTNPRVHGFYRFFGWEATLLLVVFNLPVWFNDPFAPIQIISWGLLILSILLALYGFIILVVRGKPRGSFEETTVIVATGIYKYIRHPLYASLILLTVAVGLKNPDLLSLVLVVCAALFYYFTAKVEEEEVIAKFGAGYREYIQRTKMFIPFVF
jgi:protein-S-isoprenylcysteine O-methyltransferase Ste14